MSAADKVFQSTHPLRGATMEAEQLQRIWRISIHAPLAGCDDRSASTKRRTTSISIHAPLAGCDVPRVGAMMAKEGYFNPRTPCGVRPRPVRYVPTVPRFQSTHPLRGATGHARDFCSDGTNFNPRTPCGVRPLHAQNEYILKLFQSTHPLRGATANLTNSYPQICAKATKMDLLSEEKMRYGLPQTACVSHFRSFLGAKLQRFSARLPFALRS